jgi:hypothetical protein
VEFFLWLRRGAPEISGEDVAHVVSAG